MSHNKFHVLAVLVVGLLIVITSFSTDNPLIILSEFMFCLITFYFTGNKQKLIDGFLYFIPVALISMLVNIIFTSQGSIIIFTFFGKIITLESLIYVLIVAIKLLIMIYIFILLSFLIDSDKALSYFSSIIPKGTLTLMICIKLIPSMKKRVKRLKQVYQIRGVDFDKDSNIKHKLMAHIPILSILLEDSLENSFHIAESAYIKGFLTGRRSIYERQKFKTIDFVLIIISSILLLVVVCFSFTNAINFNAYSLKDVREVITIPSIIVSFLVIILSLIIVS